MKEKNSRQLKVVGWGAAIASLFFFFNPDLSIVDFLPDFIGYALLCSAISKLADIDDRMSEALILFRKLLFLDLAKLASFILIIALIPANDRSVTILTLAFVISALELFFLIPAVIKLFEGILYLAARHDGEAVYTPARLKQKQTDRQPLTLTESLRKFTIIFAVVRAVMRTLPEFAVLSEHGYGDSIWAQMYLFISQLRILASAVVIVVGLIWLVRIFRYISLLKKDTPWIERLEQKYIETIEKHPELPARRAIKLAFGLFVAAAVMSLDIAFDGINYFSDAFSALVFLAGIAVVGKYIKNRALLSWVTVLYTVIAAAGSYVRIWFNLNYYAEDIYRDAKTMEAHLLSAGVTCAEAIMFVLVVMLILFVAIKAIIEGYTGFSMPENSPYDSSEKIRELHRQLKAKLAFPAAFAIVVAILSVASQFVYGDMKVIWVVEFVFTAIFAISLAICFRNISEQIEYKYMLS